MRWLPFFSRVAFICNLAFLAGVFLQWQPVALNEGVASTILVTGFFLAPAVFSPLVNLFYLLMLLRKKPVRTIVPLWLACTNFGFLLLQILFALFFLHDPFYH